MSAAHLAAGSAPDPAAHLAPNPAPNPAPNDAILSVRGIERSFGMDVALRGIDLDVARGEILAIMGPSGSGKSTLLHILAGVLTPDAGTAHYRAAATESAAELSALGEAERAKLRLSEFGFIFQFGQLLPDLSAVDNVSLPLLLAGTPRRVALRQARGWLERLGLAEHTEKLPSELSGGQAQRVAIARALATAPRVIFADEPTGALDSLSAEQVMLTLTELSRASGTTVVLVTHDARTAAYADREIVVRDGKLSGLSR
ncbi:ABC transporter ATP-binding protein [Leucobacter chromiireducens]|uniref:ABC transporter ATP-binding protein n=1 Tax=Leucobacter chromiireducens TaxID=283877 RepID=UPI000F63C3B8|nr:ABC transporter ATP-binding protein [Leucobacter chromiireducens]